MSEFSIRLATSKIDKALKFCCQETINECIDTGIRTHDSQYVTVSLRQIPEELIENLLKYCELTRNQSKVLTSYIQHRSGDNDFQAEISNLKELHHYIEAIGDTSTSPNVIMKFADREYPVVLNCEYRSWGGNKELIMSILIKICEINLTVFETSITPDIFTNEYGDSKKKYTLSEILDRFDLRIYDKSLHEIEKTDNLSIKAISMSRNNKGKMFSIKTGSTVLESWNFAFWSGIQHNQLDFPEKVILESEIELGDKNNNYGRRESTILPFVRGFLLNQKKYCYVHIDDLGNYEYDESCIKNLALPNKLKSTLERLFKSQKDFKDIVKDKSQGMILLAYGSSGTGKTLTAEVFSEYMKRPLYHLEISELGTDIQKIEENLQKIFIRVTRWNCVLLFDECDIFLAKRDNDLQRSALVGIFLRLLDYYSGFLFLTTNRPDVIDSAFKSRITLSLEYPELTNKIREKIYRSLLRIENIKLSEISKVELNGRQIRNVCKLANIFDSVNESDLIELAKYQM